MALRDIFILFFNSVNHVSLSLNELYQAGHTVYGLDSTFIIFSLDVFIHEQ